MDKIKLLPPEKEHQVKLNVPSIAIVKDKGEDKEIKVTEDFICNLRALAKRQKAESSAEEFAQILGNDGNDIPKPTAEDAQILRIAEELEIEEE